MFRFLLASTILVSTCIQARTLTPENNYFLRDGVNSPVFGEVGAHMSKEEGSKLSVLNARVGVQVLKSQNQALSLSYNKRGFNHGHSHQQDYKIRFDGVSSEYSYTAFALKPHLALTYLKGEKRKTVDFEKEQVRKIEKREMSFLLSYPVSTLGIDIIGGVNYAENLSNRFEDDSVTGLNLKGHKVSHREVRTMARNEKSYEQSALLGLRFSSPK